MPSKHKKWESLTKESILHKKPWFEVYSESLLLPDGEVIPEYFRIEMPHYAAVFAVTDDKKIIILRSYRHAIGEVTLTVPGGMIEKGESPLQGIKREFLEETGFVANVWESLGSFAGNSTRGCGTYHLFFASESKNVQKPNSGDLEEIEILFWSKNDVEKAINDGKAKSLGVITILMLGLRCLK